MKTKSIYTQISKSPVILSILFVLSVSCNKTLKLPDVSVERKLVLLGELTADDSTYIRAGQSVPLTSSSSLKFEILDGLTINMEDKIGTPIILNGYMDIHATTLSTLPYSSATRIQAGNTYTITATHSTLGTATTTVQIPGAFKAITTSLENVLYASDSTIKINIAIEDPSNTQNYYVIEAVKQIMDVTGYFKYNGNWLLIINNKDLYNQEKAKGSIEEKFDTTYHKNYLRNLVYTEDANAESAMMKPSTEANRRILLRDRSFNGQNYNTVVYVSKNYYLDTPSHKGRLLLQIKSVSEEYFRYLKRYDEQIDQGGVNPLTQPVKVEGNITNGVGVIGGVYKTEFIIEHDTWGF